MIDSGRCQLPLICHTKIEQQQKERKARFGKIIFFLKSLFCEDLLGKETFSENWQEQFNIDSYASALSF
jgi:hypothetical protein